MLFCAERFFPFGGLFTFRVVKMWSSAVKRRLLLVFGTKMDVRWHIFRQIWNGLFIVYALSWIKLNHLGPLAQPNCSPLRSYGTVQNTIHENKWDKSVEGTQKFKGISCSTFAELMPLNRVVVGSNPVASPAPILSSFSLSLSLSIGLLNRPLKNEQQYWLFPKVCCSAWSKSSRISQKRNKSHHPIGVKITRLCFERWCYRCLPLTAQSILSVKI